MFVGTLIKACLFSSIHHEQPNCMVLETLLSEWGLKRTPICLHISEGQNLLRLWLKQKAFPEGPLKGCFTSGKMSVLKWVITCLAFM